MVKKLLSPGWLIIIILGFAFLTRVYQLGYPKTYVFDEVYHAFTAKEYLKGNPAAWEWWTTPPPGVAYEWTHPPLAKEIMAGSMWLLHSTDSFAWRIPGVLLSLLAIWMVYKISLEIFKRQDVSLTAAFLFSIDGLNFVQSRTGMNDIYVVTFSLVSLYLFLRKKFLFSSLVLGLALASKWSAIYLFFVYFILIIKNLNWQSRSVGKLIGWPDLLHLIYLLIFPAVVYLVSYFPFFALGHSLEQFKELQQQMWWYHTNLKAHHDYSSPWWSWPLSLYPVWYFVDYQGNNMANILAAGNPVVFSAGAVAVFISLFSFIKKRSRELMIPLLGFLIFWLPWAFSPRIMFLYHYSPSVPFMTMILAYSLAPLMTPSNKKTFVAILGLMLLGFVVIYPWLVGIVLPRQIDVLFFSFSLAKNPFR